MVSQYYQNQNRLQSKITKSSLVISSGKRTKQDALIETNETENSDEVEANGNEEAIKAEEGMDNPTEERAKDKDDEDVIVSRKDSATSMISDESLSNYMKPSFIKGPQFYSEDHCNSAYETIKQNVVGAANAAGVITYLRKPRTNSDIYPIVNRNPLMNQAHDKKLNMNELTLFQRDPNMKYCLIKVIIIELFYF